MIRTFEEIVLCGVDRNRSAAFYSVPEELEAATDPAGRRGGRATPIHEAEHPSYKSSPISPIPSVFDERVSRPRGIGLSIAHAEAALARGLPVHARTGSARPRQEGKR